jgi:sugar phosphate isomerase/epimerase
MRGLEIASIFGYSYNKKISPDDNKNVNATPGTGLVDFPGLFKRLRQGGFREGSLIIECLDNVDGSQLISEAIQARKMLEDLVA